MNHEELVSGLKQLYLSTMAQDYAEIARRSEDSKCTYEQYLAALVEIELENKQKTKINRLIKHAGLLRQKNIADYDFKSRTGITVQQMNRLATGQFLREGSNVVFYGHVGVGKSHLAEGLTHALCHAGFKCLFMTVKNLINDLLVAQKSLSLASLFKKLDRYDLITLDELGYHPHDKEGADLFFQFISHRYERKSLIITTNLTYSEWDKVFLNPISTAAAVDRIIHKCETFNVKGPSWRTEEARRRALNKDETKEESLAE